jgi:3-hydroxy-D-aspartate aldolase
VRQKENRSLGPNAAFLGQPGSRYKLETPALILDVDVLDTNIAVMAGHARHHGYGLRPCAKIHKSVEISRRQVAAGALGVCCATLAEAECMASAGIPGVMLFSTVVTPRKLERLAQLNSSSDGLIVVTDDEDNVDDLAEAAKRSGRQLDVMADFVMDGGRTGAPNGERTVALARRIADADGLNYVGLQAYNGRILCIPDYETRRTASLKLIEMLRGVLEQLDTEGLRPTIVSGGGTGTHDIDPETEVFTEIQVGTYVFMDVNYAKVQLRRDGSTPFQNALHVYTTIISTSGDGYVITDAGAKEVDGTFGPIQPVIEAGAPEGSYYSMVGDDLGRIDLPAAAKGIAVGDQVRLVPPHSWQTVPLYSVYHCVSGDTLIDIWPVDAVSSW